MRGRREPRGQPHFVLPPNLYMGPPVGGLFGFKLSTLAGHRRLRAERSTSAFCSIWRRTGSRRLGLWERTARTEILEQSTSASRILSADVADAIEALALLWQILSGTGFPNQFFCDSWVVGFWRGRPWLAGCRIGKTSLNVGSCRF